MVSFLGFVLRHSKMLTAGLVGIGLFACIGLTGISITSDTRVFFDANNVHLKQLQAFEKTYAQNNNVLFVVATDDGTLITPERLAAISALTRDAWQLPHSIRVDSLTNFPHMQTRDDEFIIGDLLPEDEVPDPALLKEILRVASSDPLLVDRLISKDLTATGINVNFNLPSTGSEAITGVNTAALELAAAFERANPDLEVHVTGNVFLMKAFSVAALRDLTYLVPLGLLIILVVLLMTLRSVSETLAVASILAFSAAIATALTGWLSHPLNTASVVAPVIIMTLALASCIHVITCLHRKMREGLEQADALRSALHENLLPVAMTSVTTFIGFLAMNFADAPPLRDLGNLVIVGIIINFAFTFTLLPYIFGRLRLKVRPAAGLLDGKKLARAIRVNTFSVVTIGAVLVAVTTAGMSRLKLDDDFIRYFDESFAYRVASDFAEDRLTGLNVMDFSLNTGQTDGIFDPVYQTRVDAFTSWLRAQEKVASASSITDYTKRLHKHLSVEGHAAIPDDRRLIAQYYLLMDMGLPEGRSLSEVINTDQSASRVTVNLRHATSGDIRRMNQAAQDWLGKNAPDLVTPGISINVLFSHLSIDNIKSMIKGTVISFIAISLVVFLLLRSARLGFISLLANSIPALVGFGLWGIMVGTVNLGASVLVSMTLGIVVDDTIHFLIAWQRHFRRNNNSAEAAVAALHTVGPAMLITTIALTAGFCVLALSGFDINRTLGMFTAIIIAVALAVDLILLPAALTLTKPKRH